MQRFSFACFLLCEARFTGLVTCLIAGQHSGSFQSGQNIIKNRSFWVIFLCRADKGEIPGIRSCQLLQQTRLRLHRSLSGNIFQPQPAARET